MKFKFTKFRLVLISQVLLLLLVNKGLCDDSELPSPPDCGTVHSIRKRIIGGTYAKTNEVPWIVQLEYRKEGTIDNKCGGVLINKRYVLTAAHCLEKDLGELISVKLGVTNQMYNGTRVVIEKAKPHEDYDDFFNDIALLRLVEDIEYSSSVYPICLPFMTDNYRAPELSTNLTVAGWGRTENNSIPKRLKKVIVPFVSRIACDKLHYRKFKKGLPTTIICAGGEVGKDSCYGDSGGPLMRKIDNYWVLEGIVSYGISDDNCGTRLPATHPYVFKYDDWIKDNIRNGLSQMESSGEESNEEESSEEESSKDESSEEESSKDESSEDESSEEESSKEESREEESQESSDADINSTNDRLVELLLDVLVNLRVREKIHQK